MGTWVGAIVDVMGRADFWSVAGRYGLQPCSSNAVPERALLDFGVDYRAAPVIAQALSKDLAGRSIAFAIQTVSDVHETWAFDRGVAVRRLSYIRDDGGWRVIEGAPQDWEPSYFFGENDDLLHPAASPADRARYEAAKLKGDPSLVMDLLSPSSTAAVGRICESLGLDPGEPLARTQRRGS